MNGIKDFIAMASKQLGEPEDQTQQATGAILGVLKAKVAAGDFQQLLSALPGASDVMDEANAETATASAGASAASGMLGKAMGSMAATAGGVGGMSGALGLMGMIQQTGFAPDKVGGLVQKFMDFVRGTAGAGLATKLFTQIPELAALTK